MPSPAKNIEVVHVYGLTSSDVEHQVRYVGITSMTLSRRLQMHLSTARRGCATHRGRWIRKILNAGANVEIVVLHEATMDDWQEWERYFIATLPNLTNATAGGEGILDPTLETRERMRLAQLGKKAKPETIEKRRLAMKGNSWNVGKTLPAETRARISAANIGKHSGPKNVDEEARERIRLAAVGNTYRRGVPHTEEAKAKMRAARTGQVRRPHSAETIEKMRAAKLGRRPNEATRAKQSAAAKARPSPNEDTRRKLSEATAASWARRRVA